MIWAIISPQYGLNYYTKFIWLNCIFQCFFVEGLSWTCTDFSLPPYLVSVLVLVDVGMAHDLNYNGRLMANSLMQCISWLLRLVGGNFFEALKLHLYRDFANESNSIFEPFHNVSKVDQNRTISRWLRSHTWTSNQIVPPFFLLYVLVYWVNLALFYRDFPRCSQRLFFFLFHGTRIGTVS